MVIVAAVILIGVGVWVSTQLGTDRFKVSCKTCGGMAWLTGRMTIHVAVALDG